MRPFFEYHPNSVLHLGGGLSPTDLTAAKPEALEFNERRVSGGAPSTSLTTTLVHTARQLKETLRLDIAIDVSYLMFSGSATFSLNETSALDSSSATVVLTARTDFGRWKLHQLTLVPRAQRMLDEERHAKFAATFGTHYVVMEERGASVSVLFTITDVNSSLRSLLSSSVEGGGGWGPLRASAKVAVSKELSKASSERRLDIQVLATGGNGFADLSQIIPALVSGQDVLEKVQTQLAHYVSTFTSENAAAVRYYIAPMSDFGLQFEAADIWTEWREDCLQRIVSEYRHFTALRRRCRALSDGTDPYSPFLSDAQRVALPETEAACNRYLSALATLHQRCRTQEAADCSDLPQRPVTNLPEPPRPKPTWRARYGDERLGINESWRVISAIDRWAAGLGGDVAGPEIPDNQRMPDDIELTVDGVGITAADLVLEAPRVIRSFKFNGLDRSITLSHSRDLQLVDHIGREARAGNRTGAGTFVLILRDIFGYERRLDLAHVRWEPFSDSPEGWRIVQFDRVPYDIVPATRNLLAVHHLL